MKAPVLVLGAAGGVGRGVVEALLDAGYPVIAAGRDGERLQSMKTALERPPGIATVTGSVASEAEGAALAAAIRQLRRPLGGIVASIMGPLERGRLLDQPADFLRRKLDEDVIPHLVAARHLLPLLAENGGGGPYLIIGGPCADSPWAGYGHLSVSAAAMRMLVKVLRQEALASSVRVQQLAVCSPVRTGRGGTCDCPEWPSPLDVGRRVAALLAQPGTSDAVVRFDPLGTGDPTVPDWLSRIRDATRQ